MTDTGVRVRCSAWARQVGLSPVATIGTYQGFLLVETPLPWAKDVNDMPLLAGLAQRARANGLRLQALVPSSLESAPSGRRVILHWSPPLEDGFGGYARVETGAGASVDDAVDELISAAQAADGWHPDPVNSAEADVDVLVCTHGQRDVCCGSQGTDLAVRLLADGPPAGVHYRRTSHTGGHRFAPTFLILPHGTAWGFADTDLVERVLHRSVPFSAVASRYRGCAGLTSPQVQALERDVLALVDWELLDRRRAGFLTGELTADGGQVVRLESGADAWEGVVRPGRTLPVPDCLKPLEEAKKSETEWVVSDVRAAG